MGRTSRCSGCKMPRSEHTFSKPGKYCNGPAKGSDATPPLESLPVEEVKELSIEETLASLLVAVKSLTTALKEVKAEYQQLRALLKDHLPTKEQTDRKVPVPDPCSGGTTVSGVTLPELCAIRDPFFGAKKVTLSNTFVHHAQSVDESVRSLIYPRFCFSEDAEHDFLSSRLDRFPAVAASFVCTKAVCDSSSVQSFSPRAVCSSRFQSLSPRVVCFSFRDVYCLVAQMGEPNYLVARVPVPSALNISTWRELLQGYEDRIVCQLVLCQTFYLFLIFVLIAAPFNFRNKLPPICARKFHLAGLPVLLMPYIFPMALWFRL